MFYINIFASQQKKNKLKFKDEPWITSGLIIKNI